MSRYRTENCSLMFIFKKEICGNNVVWNVTWFGAGKYLGKVISTQIWGPEFDPQLTM